MDTTNFALSEWLLHLENRYEKEIRLGLDRITTVAHQLDLLHSKAKVITVAGTNGKGSTVTALESIYFTAGYRVGAYTSPHLITFNERIRINRQPISDESLCFAFALIEKARGDIPLSYFETTTLAALYYFKQASLDIIILEVGLGGRLDATNIIESDLAIITTVDLDHQEYLGPTKEAIGYEKAGILRANKPYIYADESPPKSVLQQAELLSSPKVVGSFEVAGDYLKIHGRSESVITVPLPNINHKAATAAILASDTLSNDLPITASQWSRAMRDVFIPGRQQVIPGKVSTILDVAHNPQAVKLLADFVHRFQPKGKVHAVFSGLKDKDLCGLIEPMQPYVDFWYPAVLSGKRAASKSLLINAFASMNQSVTTCYDDPLAAYNTATQHALPGDLIIVYGSFFMVSAVMSTNHVVETRRS